MKLVAGRANDLPPKWDGRRLSWSEWSGGPVHVCGLDTRDSCLDCGSTARPAVSIGIFYPHADDTRQTLVEATVRRTGATYLKERAVYDSPHLRLIVFRCPDCQTDVVLDRDTNTWWTLDEEDYGAEGSR